MLGSPFSVHIIGWQQTQISVHRQRAARMEQIKKHAKEDARRKQKEAGEKKRWLRLVLILLERKEEEEEDNLEEIKLQKKKLQRKKNDTRNGMWLGMDENIILEQRSKEVAQKKRKVEKQIQIVRKELHFTSVEKGDNMCELGGHLEEDVF